MRNSIKKIVSTLLCVSVLSFCALSCKNKGGSVSNASESVGVKLEDVVDFVLEVESGRDVKILQLTDIQIIDSSQQRYDGRLHSWSIDTWAPDKVEIVAFQYMRETVEAVNPDLIVLSGDNVYGEFDDSGVMLQKLVEEIESYDIPWTLTFGNHDNETRKGIEWTCEQYINAKNCMFTRGDIENVEGNGNFNVAITQGGKLTEVIWLMDSNGHTDNDPDGNSYSKQGILKGQLAWFEEENEKLKEFNGGVSPKAIGFFHHPPRAFGDALAFYGYESAANAFLTPDGNWGTFSPIIIPENNNGDIGAMRKDAGGYIDQNYKFHEMLKTYSVEGWFFGHDHRNNASCSFEGVRYTYGLKASKYDDYEVGDIGGTVITIGENPLKVNHYYCKTK